MASNNTVETRIRIIDEASKELDNIKSEFQKTGASSEGLEKRMNSVNSTLGETQKQSESFRTQIRELREAMANMLAEGVQPTDEQFRALSLRAGELQDAMGDANAIIADFASDTHNLDKYVSGMKGVVGIFGIYQSAISLAGFENDKFNETMQKMVSVTTLLNGVQEVQNQLRDQSTGIYKAYHAILRLIGVEKKNLTSATITNTAATTANTAATNATTIATKMATAAMKGLKAAIAATGIGLLVVGVGELVNKLFDLVGSLGASEDAEANFSEATSKSTQRISDQRSEIEKLNSEMDELKSKKAIDAEYEAVVNKSQEKSFEIQRKLIEQQKKRYNDQIEDAEFVRDMLNKQTSWSFEGYGTGKEGAKNAEKQIEQAEMKIKELDIELARLSQKEAEYAYKMSEEASMAAQKMAEADSMRKTFEEDKKWIDEHANYEIQSAKRVASEIAAIEKSKADMYTSVNEEVTRRIESNAKRRSESDESIKNLKEVYKDSASSIYSSAKGVTSAIDGITTSLQTEETAWGKVSAVIDGTMQMYSSVAGLIQTVQAIQEAASAARKAQAGSDMAVNSAEATSNMVVAGTGAMAAHSAIPFVGVALGAAAIAAMIATIATLPKYAEGGLAYGPTLGIFGEYSGAKSNPEVVAPLNKLRDLIGTSSQGGDVKFHIEGRDLVGVLDKQRIKSQRS